MLCRCLLDGGDQGNLFGGWFGRFFAGFSGQGWAMICRCVGFLVAVPRECSTGMLVEIVWAIFGRCQLARPCHALSTFWLLGGGGQGILRGHAFGKGLGDLLQVPADQASQ